jgi:hypothetical protein
VLVTKTMRNHLRLHNEEVENHKKKARWHGGEFRDVHAQQLNYLNIGGKKHRGGLPKITGSFYQTCSAR